MAAISRAATEGLSSEYDRTFHIAAEEGAYYLLKVVPPDCSAEGWTFR
jgi:Ser/Thr protein kinase RdoA (MazF antagonist)